VGAEVFAGAAGTSDCAELGAAGTSDCCAGAGADDTGALAADAFVAGVEPAGAELPAPAMMPSVCLGDGATP